MKPRKVHFTRSLAILHVQRRLESESFPRVQMTLIVALTGAAGLLASFCFLRVGLESMFIRYPLAVAIAYVFFLFLLWLWLRTSAEDYSSFDMPSLPGGGSSGIEMPFKGGGGDFSGAGASGSFDAPVVADAGDSASTAVGDVAGSLADGADEFAIPIAAIVLAVGLALASFYVIYIAPVLFAELFVDGALSYALYRRLRHEERQHWLETACRRTVFPFAVTALFVAIVGAAMSLYAPGARSLGDALNKGAVRDINQGDSKR